MWCLLIAVVIVRESLSLYVPPEYADEWRIFKTQYKKQYSSEAEEYMRLQTYIKNRNHVMRHNRLFSLGLVTYQQSINEFSDMLHDEFLRIMTGFLPGDTSHAVLYQSSRPKIKVAKSMDWRNYGYVTPVKNQGHCGCCWTFSATGALEGQYFNRTGLLVELSNQNLLDCAPKSGCNGGTMDDAYTYLIKHGIVSESSYPYEGKKRTCRHNSRLNLIAAKSFSLLPRGDERALLEAAYSIGPISIAIDASPLSFSLYRGGIYDDSRCSSSKVNHAVLLVGYGSENGHDYWIVKNSWGTSWGENGYIRIARNKNMCGITILATYPII